MTSLIGLDIGTTNIKAVRYNVDLGTCENIVSVATPESHPRSEWCEHNPEEMWHTIVQCLLRCIDGSSISGIGISSMAETGLPLDAHDKPLYPFIAWHDQRCMKQVAWWEQQLSIEKMHAITGQRVNPSFGVNKYLWLREEFPDTMKGMKKWLSLPDYIHWRLCGEFVTDYSIASRTLLFNQRRLDWSQELLDLAGMTREQLPLPLRGGTKAGIIRSEVASQTGLPAGTPCVLGGQDHLCAALGSGVHLTGQLADSSGTSEAVLLVVPKFYTGKQFAQQAYACYAHVIHDHYVIKAGIKSSGSAINWLIKNIFSMDPNGAIHITALYDAIKEDIGRRVGPLWLPHWLGAGSPESDRFSRAALIGVRLEHEKADILRGMLESLGFWLRQNLEELERITAVKICEIRLLGGTAQLDLLSEMKANILQRSVLVPQVRESGAVGAALLAGVGTGIFGSHAEAVISLKMDKVEFKADRELSSWYDRIYQRVYCELYPSLEKINHTIYELSQD